MRRASRRVAALLAPIALIAIAGCHTGLDITPLEPDAGTPPESPSGLALGPRVPFARSPFVGTPVSVGSDGSEWLIVTSGGAFTRDASGAFGPVWSLPAGSPYNVEIAGTTQGYFIVGTTADGSVNLVHALGDGTVLESSIVAAANPLGRSRAHIVGAGDAAWLAIESCSASHCVVRAYRMSIDARGDRVMDTLCDDCASPDPSSGYPYFAFAGNADGAVLGWDDGVGLRFRTLRFDPDASPAARALVGPVFTAPDYGFGGRELGFLSAAHGHEVSLVWHVASDLLRQRIDTRTGELVALTRVWGGSFGAYTNLSLIPVADDVLLVYQRDGSYGASALLAVEAAAPIAWGVACLPMVSAAGPSGHTLAICSGWDVVGTSMDPLLIDVYPAGVSPVPAPSSATGFTPVALGCGPSGCSIAQGASTVPLAIPSLVPGPGVALGDDSGFSGFAGIARTGGIAYVATAYDPITRQPPRIARIDVGGGVRSGTLDAHAVAVAPGRVPGTLLFADAPTEHELRVSAWNGAVLTPLSVIETAQRPPTCVEVPVACPRPEVALASGVAGFAVAWIERDARRVSLSFSPSEDAALSMPQALDDGELDKRQVTLAIAGTHALVGWEQRSTWGSFELRVAALDLASGDLLGVTTPLGELGDLRHAMVSAGDVALLAWQRPDSSLALARLDANGRPLDSTGPDAFTVAGMCTPFGLAAIDARQAAVWCHDDEMLSVRMVFLPETLR